MRRGDLVLVAVPGDYGKPRPALVVQSDLFSEHPSVTVCLLSSRLQPTPLFRYQLEPAVGNGLLVPSQVQIDKLVTIPRSRAREVIGSVTPRQMTELTRLLALWLGLGDS